MKDLFRTRSRTHITCFPITMFGIQNLMQEIAVVAWPNIAAIVALPLEMPTQVQFHETFLFSGISWQDVFPELGFQFRQKHKLLVSCQTMNRNQMKKTQNSACSDQESWNEFVEHIQHVNGRQPWMCSGRSLHDLLSGLGVKLLVLTSEAY